MAAEDTGSADTGSAGPAGSADPATAAAATGPADGAAGTAAARERLARAQTGLLAALVAGAPAPEGFDRERLAVQSRALIGKRADVVAKVAPELPEIMGEKAFRTAFASYSRARPMTGGYRRDALDFAAHVLDEDLAGGRRARRRLRMWWLERSGPEPLPAGRLARTLRVVRSR